MRKCLYHLIMSSRVTIFQYTSISCGINAASETSSHLTRFSICANRVVRVTSFFHWTYLAAGESGYRLPIMMRAVVEAGRDATKEFIKLYDTLSVFSPVELSFDTIWSP